MNLFIAICLEIFLEVLGIGELVSIGEFVSIQQQVFESSALPPLEVLL